MYACFYAAVTAALTKNKPIQESSITSILKQLSQFGEEVIPQPQLTTYQYGHLSQHNAPVKKHIPFP